MLEAILDRHPWDRRALDPSAPFLFLIWEAEFRKGKHILYGITIRGKAHVGMKVDVVGKQDRPYSTLIKSVEEKSGLLPGQEAHLHISDVPPDVDLNRGCVLATPGTIYAHKSFEAVIHVLTAEEGNPKRRAFFDRYEALFEFRGLLYLNYFRLPDPNDMVKQGENRRIQINLPVRVPIEVGSEFRISEGTAYTLVRGVVVELID